MLFLLVSFHDPSLEEKPKETGLFDTLVSTLTCLQCSGYSEAEQLGGLHGVEWSCSPQQEEREWWVKNPVWSTESERATLPSFKGPITLPP